MRLSDYIEPDLILLDLHTRGVEDTIAAFVALLAASGRAVDPDEVRKALLEREQSHTTSLGNGVALPHATVAGLTEPVIMVALAPDGVPFGRVEGAPPDRVFFVLLSPLKQAGTHIKLLARIVRLVRRPEFPDALLAAVTGEALIQQIERVDALHV